MRPLNRLQIAWRAAQDIGDGMVVNLGLGMPVAVADYLRPQADVFIHSENGVIGAGPLAGPGHIDTDLVDAGSRRITLRPGAAIVDSSWSFAAIRGGHIDVAILGAFEVAANGDLANWDMRLPNRGPLVGGAMDLASCARAVWVVMDHVTRSGAPRLLERCALPLTAVRCVKRVYTDLAVIDIAPVGMVVREMVEGLSETMLRQRTGAALTFAPDCRPLTAPHIEITAGDLS
jgi:3-oxoadipate CoA-transferase beta subunit